MNVPIDITNTFLHTKRLTIRPWNLNDLDDFYEYAKVDGVGQMAGWNPHKDKEESERILNIFIEGKFTFAVEYQNKVIGSLGLEKYDEVLYPDLPGIKAREIGYVLSKAYWGKGLMPEAVNEVIRYLFQETEAECILCGHVLTNHQSARVQEKCGFHHYVYNRIVTRRGTKEDHEMNILWKKEWEEKHDCSCL